VGGNGHSLRIMKAVKRTILVNKKALKKQASLYDSEDYDQFRDLLYEGDCVPMSSWQETSFPSCSKLHEMDFSGKARTGELEYLTSGGYNDIFYIENSALPVSEEVIVKILSYDDTDFTDRNFDRVRRDGLVLERSTKSSYVLDVFGYCGFSIVTPYAVDGTLSDRIHHWRKKKSKPQNERLKLATEAALGLAAVHNIDGEGLSSVAHADLKGGQYLFINGRMKLADFNRARFIRRNSTAPDTACTYTVGKNAGKYRSPEEYMYLPQTAKVDTWALGGILFHILTGHEVWSGVSTNKAEKLIIIGHLPKIGKHVLEGDDPVDKILSKAIDMCYVYDPEDRPKPGKIALFLQNKYTQMFGRDI